MVIVDTVVCPHCFGRAGTCCECHHGRIHRDDAAAVLRWIWARPGCACDACRRAGRQKGV